MRAATFPALLVLALASTGLAGAQALTGAALGASVTAAVRTYGPPVSVTSRDDGNHVVFVSGAATIDTLIDAEGAIVHAIDVRAHAPATIAVAVDGTLQTFAFGTLDLAQADAGFTTAADYAAGVQRAYRISPTRELVLEFDPATKRLARVVFGERVALARLGILPAVFDEAAFPYVAPVIKQSARTPGSGAAVTIVREDVDRTGVVRGVTVIVPSGDPAFDTTLTTALGDDTFEPARIGDRPIGASVFREIRH